jgi:hypothetical protein
MSLIGGLKNMDIFKEIDLPNAVNTELLYNEILNIVDVAGWKQNQISLQHDGIENWHSGIGKSDLLSSEENSYIHFHSFLEGTYIKELLRSFNFQVSHARIMNLLPKTCYTTHVDYYTRYHIPVVSKPLQTFMVFPDKEKIVRMYPGKVYWTNTHELHNFVNGTLDNRIHIVFNDASELKNLENPYLKM